MTSSRNDKSAHQGIQQRNCARPNAEPNQPFLCKTSRMLQTICSSLPNAKDNRAERCVALVNGDETRKGQAAPVHPLVMQRVAQKTPSGVIEPLIVNKC